MREATDTSAICVPCPKGQLCLEGTVLKASEGSAMLYTVTMSVVLCKAQWQAEYAAGVCLQDHVQMYILRCLCLIINFLVNQIGTVWRQIDHGMSISQAPFVSSIVTIWCSNPSCHYFIH